MKYQTLQKILSIHPKMCKQNDKGQCAYCKEIYRIGLIECHEE
jgi:hypothetical protein